MLSTKRDKKIDILRFVAIIAIIIAHTNPPSFVFQIRNFDVTLMVLLLGGSYYLSTSNKSINYPKYVYKRFKRLIFPTWIFLTSFFLFFFVLNFLLRGGEFHFSRKIVLESYTSVDGIGYIWIMRVLFIVSALNPLFLKISKKIKYNMNYFVFLMFCFVLYHILSLINTELSGELQVYYENFVLLGFGYGIISAIGIRLPQMNQKEIIIGSLWFLTAYLVLMNLNDFIPIQKFKYPPTIYYFSYGLFISFCLYSLLAIPIIRKFFDNKFVQYISNNSLTLYYWHIIPTYLLAIYGTELSFLKINFFIEFGFVFGVGFLMTVLHNKLKEYTTIKINKHSS